MNIRHLTEKIYSIQPMNLLTHICEFVRHSGTHMWQHCGLASSSLFIKGISAYRDKNSENLLLILLLILIRKLTDRNF